MAGNSNSGRKSKPKHLRDLHGSRERPHHKAAPTYERQMPAKPEIVESDPIASLKWDDLGARLFAAGVIDESHGEILAVLCMAWADLDRARQEFKAMNYQMVTGVSTNDDGDVVISTYAKANPIIGRIEKLSFMVARYLAEFGLTPISSAKVAGEAAVADDDPLDKILTGNFGDKVKAGAA